MKKIIVSLAILTLVSCKKENTNITDSSATAENSANTASTTSLKEMDSEQISNFLQKKNDTLYVTNFFATWCGPCMHEIPYFKEKMDELKDEKVKFTFVSIDRPSDWDKVNSFAKSSGLGNNIVIFNYETMSEDFFSKNFQMWDGSAIPFTLITKGEKRDEHLGMMSKEALSYKINSLK